MVSSYRSLLLFAFALLALLLAWCKPDCLPHKLHVIVVFFLATFQRRSQKRSAFLVFTHSRPVGGCVAQIIADLQVHLLLNEELDQIAVSLTCRNMQTGESLLILYFQLSSVSYECLDYVDHVPERCFMQGCVAANVHVLLKIGLGVMLEQDVD